MDVVYKGFFDENNKHPFAIIETGDVAATQEDAKVFFDDMNVGTATSISNIPARTNTGAATAALYDVRSPWADVEGLAATTKLQVVERMGFCISAGTGTYNAYGVGMYSTDGSVIFAANTNAYKTNVGSICLNLNPEGLGTTTSRKTTTYATGVVRHEVIFTGTAELTIQTMPDGSVFFFMTSVRAVPPHIGTLSSAANNFFSGLGPLETGKMYCLRSSTIAAQGVVYNAAGGAAPNCSVMAFNRVTGRNVGKTKSAADGTYSLMAIASKGEQLFIVCLDDDGLAPDFDAQIIDRVLVN